MKQDKKVFVIEAGVAKQLTHYVGDNIDGDELWMSRFNFSAPEAVIQTHLDLLREGPDIIYTNTYQASVDGYMKYLNLNEYESLDLIRKTVRFAHTARDKYLQERKSVEKPLIAAAIGPYGAALHDGSEYSGNYADKITIDKLKEWHRSRIAACIEAGVDLLAVSTVPCLIEAEAVTDLICTEFSETKFWLSFQCKDTTTLANGDNFANAVSIIWNKVKQYKSHQLLAIGVNCVHPTFVTPLFKSINGHLSAEDQIPLIAKPNSGEKYNVQKGWYGKQDCVPLDVYIPEWIALGAKYIGGGCRTDISDIKRIKNAVNMI